MAERTIVTLGDTRAALVEGKKYTTLRDILVTMNAVDVAAVFEDMPRCPWQECGWCRTGPEQRRWAYPRSEPR